MSDRANPTSRSVELVADLNAQDDDGLGWSTLSNAVDPASIAVGRVLIAGNAHAHAIVKIVAVDSDGHIHFEIVATTIEDSGALAS